MLRHTTVEGFNRFRDPGTARKWNMGVRATVARRKGNWLTLGILD